MHISYLKKCYEIKFANPINNRLAFLLQFFVTEKLKSDEFSFITILVVFLNI